MAGRWKALGLLPNFLLLLHQQPSTLLQLLNLFIISIQQNIFHRHHHNPCKLDKFLCYIYTNMIEGPK
eukprot:4191965-Ditylum_brightwellii.AAC.1